MHYTTIRRTLFFLTFILAAYYGQSQLVIVPNTNAQQLAQKLVGDGVSISNITINGSPLATGFFNNQGGTSLGLDSGIVMATGRVKTNGFDIGLDGPSTSFASESLNMPGDPQLAALAGVTNTYDATILEFDFVPLGDTVKFNYVFSSEEYPTFNCSGFNDVFAFFISGPGITGAPNIALVPGTNIPVAINSVNDGTGGGSACTNMGPGSPFTQYYVTNTSSYLTHNGHTVVFTAIAAVQPCQTYHLKIAIADAGDSAYDSNVFLQARSLTSAALQVLNNNADVNGIPTIIEGCTSGSIEVARSMKLPFAQPVNLFYSGSAGNGTDVQMLPATVTIPANDSVVLIPVHAFADNLVEGAEILKIYVAYGGCVVGTYYSDSTEIQIRDQMNATTSTLNTTCTASTGAVTVNMTPGTGVPPFTYSLNGASFIDTNYFNNLAQGTYVVTVKDSTGCTYNINVNVGLDNNLTIQTANDTSICVGASFTANTSSNATAFSWSPATGVSNPTLQNPVITPQTGNSVYIVTASTGNCSVRDTLNITTFPGPQVNAGPDLTIVTGDIIQLQATAGPGTYSWSPATSLSGTNILNPFANPTASTVYTLTATSPQGCVSTDAMMLTVVECIDPMEAFTPNGDGINDTWLITQNNCLRQAKVQVFNRYGNIVYESENYQNNWDGKYNGKPIPDGTYYFVISYQLINNKTIYKKGNVTILR